MNGEYPDHWKPVADRHQDDTPPKQRWSTTGSGQRFPLIVDPGTPYPTSFPTGREPRYISDLHVVTINKTGPQLPHKQTRANKPPHHRTPPPSNHTAPPRGVGGGPTQAPPTP